MARGLKLALVTLAVELLLAFALVSKNFGLFALMAMPFIGIAWLPAAFMMFSELRLRPDARPLPYLGALLCFVTGMACLAIAARWSTVGLFGK